MALDILFRIYEPSELPCSIDSSTAVLNGSVSKLDDRLMMWRTVMFLDVKGESIQEGSLLEYYRTLECSDGFSNRQSTTGLTLGVSLPPRYRHASLQIKTIHLARNEFVGNKTMWGRI